MDAFSWKCFSTELVRNAGWQAAEKLWSGCKPRTSVRLSGFSNPLKRWETNLRAFESKLGPRAFGLYPITTSRVLHISLVFREMWDTAGLASRLLKAKKKVGPSSIRRH
jgi:hypothetical protein